MSKRLMAMVLCLCMIACLFAGCGSSESDTAAPAQPEDNVINLWAFTDEVPKMIEKYLADHPDFGYEVKTTIIATTDGAYQPALDQALAAGGADAPDIYCAEAAFVLKYAQGDASQYAAAYEDLGIDVAAKIEEAAAKTAGLKLSVSESESKIAELIEKRNSTEKLGIELRSGEREQTAQREKIGGELARLTERKEVMLKEYDDVIRQLYDEYQLTRSEAESMGIRIEKPSDAKRELADVKSKIRSLGNVNVSAIEEYKEVSERYEFMSAQINDVETTRAELHKLINQLTHQMQDIFTEGFEKINENFSKTFTELFGGGSASLTLSEPENVLESGIDINVKLPGKNVPSLDGLSGGEKALIALSIYFAIMRVNAPPFCFLDEVDTALDDINVERFADYMKKSDYSTQFICVTHRRGTMEAADMLYGVTMQEKGITKLLELNVSELEKTLIETKGA